MTKTRTAWLAFALLASVSISAVVAMTAGAWQTPATAVEPMTTDQSVAQIEPADDTAVKPTTTSWPDVSARDAVDPPPPIILRGAELPADPSPPAPAAMPPAAPRTITNIASRHWHDSNAGIKVTAASSQQMMGANGQPIPGVNAQQIRRARDSKAEMRVKRSKAAANTRACAPPSNGFAGLLRRLNLSPRCPAAAAYAGRMG
jgi:hypothetical protein